LCKKLLFWIQKAFILKHWYLLETVGSLLNRPLNFSSLNMYLATFVTLILFLIMYT
jgi:hypothetical protein